MEGRTKLRKLKAARGFQTLVFKVADVQSCWSSKVVVFKVVDVQSCWSSKLAVFKGVDL